MKKEKIKCYEKFPAWMVLIANLHSIAIYVIGFCIILQLGFIYSLVYLVYIAFLEIRVMNKSCINCYYYGKVCCFGKGKLACLLFRKGNTKTFINKKISWTDVLPDFLVSVIPIAVGIVVLIMNFNWWILILIILLVILVSFGNSFVRGQLACKYCKQRELGCPACKLFNKKKKGKNKK